MRSYIEPTSVDEISCHLKKNIKVNYLELIQNPDQRNFLITPVRLENMMKFLLFTTKINILQYEDVCKIV